MSALITLSPLMEAWLTSIKSKIWTTKLITVYELPWQHKGLTRFIWFIVTQNDKLVMAGYPQ